MTRTFPVVLITIVSATAAAHAQSSSLHTTSPGMRNPMSRPMVRDRHSRLSPAIAQVSLVAVGRPTPRKFAVNDLLTVIIRESVEATSLATLDTEKSVEFEGEISEFPNLRLKDLLDFQLTPSEFDDGRPSLGIEFDSEFEGEGKRKRSDPLLMRVAATVIDVKPNGTLVIEGRKFLKTDKETTIVLVTGRCRAEDITAVNTILSTQIHDLNMTVEHEGELRKASQKGWLTKLFEGLLNF